MTAKSGLLTALVAAVVAALVTVATLSILARVAPGMLALSGAAIQDQQIVDVVRNYLTKNPEILVEMTSELDKRQAAEQEAKQQKVISDNADAIFRSPLAYVAGNPDGNVSVVEFFDYNCGYCRKAFDKMMTLAAPNSKVRFIFKEFPILSPESEVAAKAAFAAKKQNKYLEFHRGLMSHPGRANEQAIEDVAKKIGLNMNQFHKDMNSPDAESHVSANLKLGTDLGIDGTPSFIVDGKLIGGWSEKDVDAAIAGGKS